LTAYLPVLESSEAALSGNLVTPSVPVENFCCDPEVPLMMSDKGHAGAMVGCCETFLVKYIFLNIYMFETCALTMYTNEILLNFKITFSFYMYMYVHESKPPKIMIVCFVFSLDYIY